MSTARPLALASLRGRLDDGSVDSRWTVDSDGVPGRVLEIGVGATYTVPLKLTHAVRLRTRARLYPHDWRDREGALRAVVIAWDADGARRQMWATTLRAGDRGRPGGRVAEVTLPASTTALALGVHGLRRPPDDPVTRVLWADPVLVGATGSPTTLVVSPAPEPSPEACEGPLFSVLVPVHDPPLAMLNEAIESVRAQSFRGWELCLADDGSRELAVTDALARHAARDGRIRLVRLSTARGISAATNSALGLARGAYVALLDHDDTLAPDALQRVAERIAAEPDLDMIYTDEDIVDQGRQVWVHLKPAWSPDTLRTNGYTCHLGVYRRSLVQEIGGFRSEFDGSQDIDMILRLTERTDRIAHVPEILYHWRAHAASTAGGDAKPYAYVAARNAYAAHLERTGSGGEVGYGPPGLYRLSPRRDASRRIAIVLAVADAAGLTAAAGTWAEQPHEEWAVVVSAPRAVASDLRTALETAGLREERVTILAADSSSPTAENLQLAAGLAATRADDLLLLQAPVAGLTHDWLARLAGYVAQDGIAAAGPVVLASDGRVLHAGVALPEGVALHLLHGSRTSMDDFFGYGTSVYNVSALSGALMMTAAQFGELGGLEPSLNDLALVDLCVRAGEAGQRIVTVPDVRMRLTVPDPTINDLPALRALQRRWQATHDGDPYYNPGYRTDRGDFARRAG